MFGFLKKKKKLEGTSINGFAHDSVEIGNIGICSQVKGPIQQYLNGINSIPTQQIQRGDLLFTVKKPKSMVHGVISRSERIANFFDKRSDGSSNICHTAIATLPGYCIEMQAPGLVVTDYHSKQVDMLVFRPKKEYALIAQKAADVAELLFSKLGFKADMTSSQIATVLKNIKNKSKVSHTIYSPQKAAYSLTKKQFHNRANIMKHTFIARNKIQEISRLSELQFVQRFFKSFKIDKKALFCSELSIICYLIGFYFACIEAYKHQRKIPEHLVDVLFNKSTTTSPASLFQELHCGPSVSCWEYVGRVLDSNEK